MVGSRYWARTKKAFVDTTAKAIPTKAQNTIYLMRLNLSIAKWIPTELGRLRHPSDILSEHGQRPLYRCLHLKIRFGFKKLFKNLLRLRTREAQHHQRGESLVKHIG